MTTWTSDECAAHWGVQVGTWNSYVSRGQAPAPLPGPGPDGRKVWDADEVRSWSRPGAGRRRTSGDADELLARMRGTGAELEELRSRQRELLRAGREAGCEISAMASALGISRQTAYAWLKD
ncbi:hypothetical protein Ae168Ps1_5833 [Pseudonocardia sp. Ae168_Ps1]|uniref:hypothetical protein n=1 Tax=unclassified Pseudonocardia TaxID=2619320 RepID=UPI0001FFDE85|nr:MULTISPECIES: hypothetical protein [unclassified Pseudonocardia]ALE76381.1 hypothetical protein FRP1_16050 [Pseudonocardia sp. EC080625-04]ALL79065.1 hypothetical protein AD006_23700 [Pseudonocardia sp. EC080610-09]ALL84239.1 hypothetical protein AD017_03290 [Pseudonocardia sp. EC080619-01]OLL71330.1 hypothetical protein Ae168Ps1_5833 [Pseudonocardia sp. Ae168_Ps1]OLL77119.1 hypothetical protein Ae150APs1_5497c [Pseudonocardia sp. Ae150A_Ps1]